MKWALITGGAKGLGASLCLSLAEQGRAIAVHYHTSQIEAEHVVTECRKKGVHSEAIQGDFSSTDTTNDFIKRYLDRFSETDLLVNNIGNYYIASATSTPIKEWERLFQLNLHTPFALTTAFAPSLVRNRGNIINIGVSGLLRLQANTYTTAYTLTKQALYSLTLSLAKEWASHGIRVNMVSPGELDYSIDHHKIPMDRPGTCLEVCRVVNFLLDPQSGYITGQNIEVAGGLGLGKSGKS